MSNKFSIQIKIAAIIVLVIALVGSTGFYAYQNMSGIIKDLREEIRPDFKLVLVKEVMSDLNFAENNVKSYKLTGNKAYLTSFYTTVSNIDEQLDVLYLQNEDSIFERSLDSLSILIEKKFDLLNEILLQEDEYRANEALEAVSSKINYAAVKKERKNDKSDTIQQEVSQNQTDEEPKARERKSNIFQRLFGKKKNKKETNVEADTLAILTKEEVEKASEKKVKVEEVQQEIAKVQKQEEKVEVRLKEEELNLIVRDEAVMDNIRLIVKEMESSEMLDIEYKTAIAEQNASLANKWIIGFCIAASMLLLTAILLLLNYVGKNTAFNKALQGAKTEAEDLALAKENFLANMSHEIRTPMNAISGFTEQIMQGQLTEKQKEQFTIIKKSSDHLLEVVNDILDFSKLQAGKLEIEKIGFKPVELINDVVIIMQPEAQKKNLQLGATYSGDLPKVLIGDPLRLRQVLLNLVSNAIKFTKKGKVSISASTILQNNKVATLRINVTDTGIGIPEEKLNSIFGEFEQAETATTREFGGTGLGLAISKRLIELQRGNIKVQSQLQKGTEFTIEIPYLKGTEKNITHASSTSINTELLVGKKILIADDELYNRKLLTAILAKLNMPYTEAENGKQAIKELEQNNYDAVLMDMRMPELNGVDATAAIRKLDNPIKASVPILALTAAITEEDKKKCLEAGMNGFLSKPFKEEDLINWFTKNLLHGTQAVISKTEEFNPGAEQNEQLFDLNELKELSNGDTKFFDEMITTFIHSTKEGMAQISQNSKKGDWEKVAGYAHKISSPCHHIGATQLYKNLKAIELNAKNEKQLYSLPSLIKETEELANKTIQQIESSAS